MSNILTLITVSIVHSFFLQVFQNPYIKIDFYLHLYLIFSELFGPTVFFLSLFFVLLG